MAEDGEVVFEEEGMTWLPSHVPDETCQAKTYLRNQQNQQRHGPPARAQAVEPEPLRRKTKRPAKSHFGPKSLCSNWVSGGPGMQAIFLDSGRRSEGTGVFLPQTPRANPQPSREKPACAPVLLPSRVVQALNLNVQSLGLRISRRPDTKEKPNNVEPNLVKNQDGKDATQRRIVMQSQSSSSSCSSDLLLPKEWTY
ncbi:uncharacterized protein LOC115752033 [Rhodamnia argentea]|uniref:Uncharacterized protein LOC115752033 n=1 Tax=Rhodamnia argentea TaxID=178133 RepID=A0A8B8QFS1_9MYRT|nr:uncharacterized protein LOC115752033 [Rhodamnia argentea]